MKLAIDAGHGMGNRTVGVFDTGATGHGYTEAAIVFAYAKSLKHYCMANGLNVYMVRKDETTNTPVSERATRARLHGCTHYISLHCNAFDDPSVKGIETYYRYKTPFVELVHSTSQKVLLLNDRGLKAEGNSQHSKLAVLSFFGPACLVELGFITNQYDAMRLEKAAVRFNWAKQLANAIAGMKT